MLMCVFFTATSNMAMPQAEFDEMMRGLLEADQLATSSPPPVVNAEDEAEKRRERLYALEREDDRQREEKFRDRQHRNSDPALRAAKQAMLRATLQAIERGAANPKP